jgi:chaperonin GroES
MAFRPLHDRVVVRRVDADTVSPGGILLSQAHLEKPQEGEIVAVGQGLNVNGTVVPLTVAAGDHVLFGKWSGTEITLDGEKLLIMKEEDILGILEQGE